MKTNSASSETISQKVQNNTNFANNSGAGINLAADNNASITGRIANTMITGNTHGVMLETNADMSLNDLSLIDLDFQFATVESNSLDGLNLVATNGDDTAISQTTGIIVDFDSGTVRNNTDDGVDGTANGDNSVPANTRVTVTVNFSNSATTPNGGNDVEKTANGMGQVDVN